MYTILLVDDERSVIDALTMQIDWKNLGVDTVLTASNGQEALDYARSRPIALVVADIRMPGMDGLTLVRHLRQYSPETHCILLSAYDEFAYAREAMALGVENYLLKPLSLEEVEQTVKRALQNIYANRSGSYLAYANTLLRWVTGAISREELADRSIHFGINLYLPEYAVACIYKLKPAHISNYLERCHEIFAKEISIYHCRDEMNRALLLMGGSCLVLNEIHDKLVLLAEQESVLDCIKIVIGKVVADAMELPQSYLEACSALETDMLFAADSNGAKALPQSEDIQLILHERNSQMAEQQIQKYISTISESYDQKDIIQYFQACIHTVLLEYPNAKEDIKNQFVQRQKEFESIIARYGLRAALKEVLLCTRKLYFMQFDKLSPIVQLALCYIWNNFNDGISIREFCNRKRINPAYLGHLFKCEFGVFFNEYLLYIRISYATILLRDPNLRIADIAEHAGFASTSYFIKCFKNSKGISPARYRVEYYHVFLNED